MYRWLGLVGVICVATALWIRHDAVSGPLLRIGVTAGPHALIAEHVKKRMEPTGLKVKIIEFNDFHLPNAALDAGELDLNIYQHEPFLKEDCATRHLKLIEVGKSVLMPMGLYSARFKKIKDLPANAKIALPNDPTNRERAKSLCLEMGIKEANYIEVDAPQLPRTLEDVDAALIPTDWIVLANMDPKQALCHENAAHSPYTNIIVAKEGTLQKPEIQTFLANYQSAETKQFVKTEFGGALVAGW